MLHRLVNGLLLGSVLLLGASLWMRDALPEPQAVRAELLEEPAQVAVRKKAFDTTVNGVTYTVQPLYSYDLHGVVVSMHDTKSWWDYIHRAWNDSLNVVDLCVVWGPNLQNRLYREMSYWNTETWCYYQTRSNEVNAAFDANAMANNHLLTDDPRLAKKLSEVRIGDQVRVRGYLAEYSHNHGFAFKRGTSTVRTDTGNGACETVFVEAFENLRPAGGPWRKLVWVSVFMLLASLVAWLCLPVRFK